MLHPLLILVVGVPLVCLLMGLLVCSMDLSAMDTFKNLRPYQVPFGLMVMGALVWLILALIGGVTRGIYFALRVIGVESAAIAFVLALVVVLGGIGWWGESSAYRAHQTKRREYEEKL